MAFIRILDGDVSSISVTASASDADSCSDLFDSGGCSSHYFSSNHKRLDERYFCCCNKKLNLLRKPVAFMSLLFLFPFIPMGFLFESDRDQNYINSAYLDCCLV